MKEYRVHRITPQDAYPWLLKKHYAHRLPSISWAFGLYQFKDIIGVCTFGKPASPSLCDGICGKEYSQYVYELNRLVVNDGLPDNSLSYLVSRCLKNYHANRIIVSYADTQQNHIGYIYQATNWIYTGKTKERTDIGQEDGTHSRHYNKNSDYSIRKFRSSKHRYVYFIGNKRFKKQAIKSLRYDVLPYPKGDNKNYDTTAKVEIQKRLF